MRSTGIYPDFQNDTTQGKAIVPAKTISPGHADSSVNKRHDSLGTHHRKDSIHIKKAVPTERFILPDTIKIEYVKPGYKLKKLKADTLNPAPVMQEKVETVPFYNRHLLRAVHTNPVPLNKESADWIFFVLYFILTAFTFVKVIHAKNLKQVREAFFSNTISNQIVRDESILFQRTSVFLTIIFYAVGALFLYKLSVIYGIHYKYLPQGFGRFLIFVLIISMAYSLKLIILKMIGFIFQIDKAVINYIFNVFLINNVLGILLIPVLIGICFLPDNFTNYIVYSGEFLVVSAFIYRIIRGITIGLSYPSFSLYYLFLYLCTLEIAPLLFLIKILN